MKKYYTTLLFALLAAGSIAITGCGEDTVEPDPENEKEARVRLTFAAESLSAVDLMIDGEEIAANAIFGDNINYRTVQATNLPVKIVNTGTGSVLFEKTFNFVDNRNYTLFITNDSSGTVDVLKYTDDLTPPTGSNALIRPVYLVNDGPQVRIGLAGSGIKLTDSIRYAQIFESFNSVPSGTYNFRVIPTTESGGGNMQGGGAALVEKSMTIEAGGIYSLVASSRVAQAELVLVRHN